MLAESDLRNMRATFEVNLSFIPQHIKSMKYKAYKSASPSTLAENKDPAVRRQSSLLKFKPPPMGAPLATPAASRSKARGHGILQTPMVRTFIVVIHAHLLGCHLFAHCIA